MPRLVVGLEASEYVAVTSIGATHASATDYWDGNWMRCQISVVVQGFRGSVEADLRREEFGRFLDALRVLEKSLRGEAAFETMERCLSLKLTGDGRGRIRVTGSVTRFAGVRNHLTFELPEHDQTMLVPLIKQLAAWQQEFPVIGSPAV